MKPIEAHMQEYGTTNLDTALLNRAKRHFSVAKNGFPLLWVFPFSFLHIFVNLSFPTSVMLPQGCVDPQILAMDRP